ncbi:hypothetical protein BC829DRAFT_207363 [Chytridium lagenaria]|nr:hypothetical protein BC829DRAFT_207363 [Chytridium lagenaria]
MQPQQLNLGIYGYGERFYTTQHFLPRWSEEVHPEAFRNDTWVYTVKARLENWDVWIKRFDDDKDKHVLTRSEYLRYAKILDDTRFAGLSAMDALDLEFSMLKFDSEMKNFVMCVLLDSFSPTPPPPLPNVPSEFRTIVSPIWRKRSRSESIDIPTTSPMSSPLAFPTTPRLRSPKSEHPSPLLLDLEPPRKFRNVETATGFMALSSLEDTFGFDILNSPPPPQFRTQIII